MTLSSMEAEYVEATFAGQECLWWRRLLKAFGFEQKEATPIMEDNKACISFSLNHTAYNRSKHIDIREFWLRERVLTKELELMHVATDDQLADCMTKYLPTKKFKFFRDIFYSGLHNGMPKFEKNKFACKYMLEQNGQGKRFRTEEIEGIDCW